MSDHAALSVSHGVAGLALLICALFGVIVAAEIAGFLTTAAGRSTDNLSVATFWAARPERWWTDPFVVIAPLLFLPIAAEFGWARSPRALLAALKRVRPAAVWIGPAIFVAGLVFVVVTADIGLFRYFVLGLIGFSAVALTVVWLFGWATRAGFPQSASMLVLAAAAGAVSGVMSADPVTTLACEPGAEIEWRNDARTTCAEILVHDKRGAHLVRRQDGALVILPKGSADPASLRKAAGARSVWFDEVKPVD